MQIDMSYVLESYREEVSKLANENTLLKAQVKQLQNELESTKQEGCE